MKMIRTGEREVKFSLDTVFLSQYGLDLETFEKRKPFTTKIIDELLDMANEKYGLNFDEFDTPKAICILYDRVVMVFEKSNLVYLETDETEELEVMKGIRELFRFLQDEKIDLGIMDIEEKQKLLDEIRNDDGMTYIRENFIIYE